MKKLQLAFFAAGALYFAALLAVPGFLVVRHYTILRTGARYKFAVRPYDPYDPFRGRYVAIRASGMDAEGAGSYALLDVDSEGFAFVSAWQKTPPQDGAAYAKKLDIRRYYLNEKIAPQVERLQGSLDPETETMYVQAAVKNGGWVLEGMYVNGIPVEEYARGR